MMKRRAQLSMGGFLVASFYLIFPTRVYAYLDPGTASYIFQLIVAVMVSGVFVVKLYWCKIKNLFKNLIHARRKDEKAQS